jgi:signal transduction histidine kinase
MGGIEQRLRTGWSSSLFGVDAGAAAQLWLVLRGPIVTAIAYYAGAAAAFLIGTFSDKVYAPFWPPNAILFCALVVAERRQWPLYVAAVFPAHYLAELWVAMPPGQMLVAFATNCAAAVLGAIALRSAGISSDWFSDVRRTLTYIVILGAIVPGVAALGGAFVRIAGGAPASDFALYWANWYTGNALAFLTLSPIFLAWASRRHPYRIAFSVLRVSEFAFVSIGLIIACGVSFRLGVTENAGGFQPALLYLPLPFTIWATVRLGVRGASAAILVVTVVSIWSALKGPSIFLGDGPERTAAAMQLFLMGEAVLMLMLGAAIDQMRTAEAAKRRLVAAVMKAQDEERRAIARDLHDSTGQQLIAALMLVDRASIAAPTEQATELRGLITRSIADLRTVSYLLHPPLLDEAGFAIALEKFVEGYSARTGVEVKVDLPRDARLMPREVELVLFRVVQEALTNVSRHSGSHFAKVGLAIEGGWSDRVAILTVEDFGVGIPGIAGVPSFLGDGGKFASVRGGVGLSSMAERLGQIGGQLEIMSRVGWTVVRAEVPFPGERHPARPGTASPAN